MPEFNALFVELKRKDRVVKCEEIDIEFESRTKVPVDLKMNLVSNFYVDKQKKVMDKDMALRLMGTEDGKEQLIGNAEFNIAVFYGKK